MGAIASSMAWRTSSIDDGPMLDRMSSEDDLWVAKYRSNLFGKVCGNGFPCGPAGICVGRPVAVASIVPGMG